MRWIFAAILMSMLLHCSGAYAEDAKERVVDVLSGTRA